MLVDALSVNVYLATREIPTLAVSRESVMRILTAGRSVPVKTTTVLTHALSPVAREQTVQFRIMWPSAGAHVAQPETHSVAVEDLPAKKSVPLADVIQTVRLVLMTVLCVPVSLPILVILWLNVNMSVIQIENVAPLNHVTVENIGKYFILLFKIIQIEE